jgi:hypothetical protein
MGFLVYYLQYMRNLGITSILGLSLLAVLGGGCGGQEPRGSLAPPKTQVGPSTLPLSDCKDANNVFACILDRAMDAKDPSVCATAGEEKRMNCVRAYVEITGAPVECRVFMDPKFRAECEKAYSSVTSAPSDGASTATSSAAFGSDGLHIDQTNNKQ